MKQEWFKEYFDSSYGKIILDPIKESYTKQQVDFILQALEPEPGSSFLDLFCGKGRHSLVLAKHNYQVTSIDLIPEYIEALSSNATEANLPIQCICQDARSIEYRNQFDHIIVMFTSFGYFTDDENQELLSKIRRALKPEGTCIIDVENRDYLLKFFIKEKWRKKSYGWLLERMKYHPKTSQHRTLRVVIDKQGNATESERLIRLYSQHEILQMSRKANLKPVQIYGDYDGTLCKKLSPRIIAVLRK